MGGSLEKLDKIIDWEIFRTIISEALAKTAKGSGECPACDFILMLKILILQRIYNLSDDQTKFQIIK